MIPMFCGQLAIIRLKMPMVTKRNNRIYTSMNVGPMSCNAGSFEAQG